MKTITIIVILSLTLSSCSVYTKKIVEQYPAKYEYRCIRDVCKDVNMNYKYKYITKDKYKHLSEEELKNKKQYFDNIAEYTFGSFWLVTPVAVGVNTAINTWGVGISGAFAGLGWGALSGIGVYFMIGLGAIIIPMFICNSEGEDKFYDMSCSIGKQKPSEAK